MNEDFEYLLTKYGRPVDALFLNDDKLDSYRGQLPSSLIDFWREVGLGAWSNGAFQFCQPDHYASTLEAVLQNDPQFDHSDCTLFGYEAFCRVHIWHKTLGHMTIDLTFGDVQADFTGSEKRREIIEKLGPDRVIAIRLSGVVQDSDIKDEDGVPMFERAVKKLGAPQRNECFGFVPALGLGGARELRDLRRIRAPEHFAIIAGLNRFRLIKREGLEMVTVRMIGG